MRYLCCNKWQSDAVLSLQSASLCYCIVVKRLLRILDAGKSGVDHDSAAVLTHDHFLVELYFHLLLRGDAVEATAASVTLHIHNAEAVAGILAYALEGRECALVNFGLKGFGFLAQVFLILTCLADDLIQLSFLFLQDMGLIAGLVL